MFTRYSSSIFSLNSLAVFALRVRRHAILHICGSLIRNCKKPSVRTKFHNLEGKKGIQIVSVYPSSSKKVIHLINRVLNAITTKNFTKILCTVHNAPWLTVRKGIVGIRKLSSRRGQFVNFHLEKITLPNEGYN